jgi:hypothetical protein
MDHTRELPHCAMSNFMIADARPNWKEQGATEARGTSDLTIRVRLNGDSVWGAARDD